MNDGGADVNFSARGLSDVCTYVALSHNHFSNAYGQIFLLWNTQRNGSYQNQVLQCSVQLC